MVTNKKVLVSKPFFYYNNNTQTFQNFFGKVGKLKYSNYRGSMVVFEKGFEIFIPKDAIKKI